MIPFGADAGAGLANFSPLLVMLEIAIFMSRHVMF
jgi:hypothetical protein